MKSYVLLLGTALLASCGSKGKLSGGVQTETVAVESTQKSSDAQPAVTPL